MGRSCERRCVPVLWCARVPVVVALPRRVLWRRPAEYRCRTFVRRTGSYRDSSKSSCAGADDQWAPAGRTGPWVLVARNVAPPLQSCPNPRSLRTTVWLAETNKTIQTTASTSRMSSALQKPTQSWLKENHPLKNWWPVLPSTKMFFNGTARLWVLNENIVKGLVERRLDNYTQNTTSLMFNVRAS